MQGRMFFPFSSPWSRLRTTSSCMRWDVGGNFVVLIHFRGFLLLKLLRGPHHERRSITIGPALRCYCECCRSSSEGLSMDGRGTKKKNGPDRLLILTLEAVYQPKQSCFSNPGVRVKVRTFMFLQLADSYTERKKSLKSSHAVSPSHCLFPTEPEGCSSSLCADVCSWEVPTCLESWRWPQQLAMG